jgi:hypothetical protein
VWLPCLCQRDKVAILLVRPFGRTQKVSSALVMRLGQRFESARRLATIGVDKPN